VQWHYQHVNFIDAMICGNGGMFHKVKPVTRMGLMGKKLQGIDLGVETLDSHVATDR
jgi:hypothetical protein